MTDPKLFLLPCPFCWREARCIEYAGLFVAGCDACSIRTDTWTTSRGAVDAWNKRGPVDHNATGQTMRRFREDSGLSVKELAARVGWSAQYVSDIEHGRRSWTNEKMTRVLEALNKTR